MMKNLFSKKQSLLGMAGFLLTGATIFAQNNPTCAIDFPISLENGTGDLKEVTLADDFVVGAGSSINVSKLNFRLINSIVSANQIVIYQDNNGTPGNVVTTFTNLAPSSQTEVGFNVGMPFFDVVFDLPTIVELTEGTYWLGIQVNGANESAINYWAITNSNILNPGKFTEDNGATWQINSGNFSWSFKLEGECEGDVTVGNGGPCEDKTVMECGVEYTATLEPNAGSWVNYTAVTYNYTGSEKVFEFTAPSTGAYQFEVNQGTADADFLVMNACGNLSGNVINHYWTGEQSEYINLEAGLTYYIIADLYESANSSTTVSVKVNCPDNVVIEEPDFACFQGDGIPSSIDEGANIDPVNVQIKVADDFIVDPGTQFTIRQITMDTNQIQVPDNAVINIRENVNGKPGAVLETISIAPTSAVEYAAAFNEPVYHMTFDLATPLVFGEGTYWLEPKMTTPQTSTVWWVATTSGSNGASALLSEDAGTTWAPIVDGLQMVFFVAGECEELGTSNLDSFNFAYYPNPVNDVLNITAQKAVKSVEAYNLAGQKVMSGAKVNNGQINVNALTPGTYVFKVTLEGGQIETFKIVKK